MESPEHRYFIINKPFNMVSQFESPDNVGLLGDLAFPFPAGTHAIGRLDNHSEGLLILTTDKRVTRLLFESTPPHPRTYLVQVSGTVPEGRLNQLREGIDIRVKGGGYWKTSPCVVEVVQEPPYLHVPACIAPVFFPFTWLLMTLNEGKFHQVRKMVAAVHHKCRRLVRLSIHDLHLGELAPGEVRELDAGTFYAALHLTPGAGTAGNG
jgi:23S rRNA pseudouridine2457 synthase